MALRLAALRVGQVSSAALRTPAIAISTRAMNGYISFNEREKGEELVHIRQQEKELLLKLRQNKKIANVELKELLGPHQLPDDVLEKLIEWKFKQ
ncbi:hypothetical protein JKP88DRAFT_350966 [Tribonema minus]|uniref:Uncharacterized protein n=1 Tax=Tribonema minus TaxID=303371 RepID=A0A835YNK7_9STRA|nr:hypothetical protein JKP88DRAFT_350966 [Tribonema minus]